MPTKPKTHNPIHPALRAKLEAQKAADRERRRKEYEKGEQRTEDRAFYKTARWIAFRKYAMSLTENALCRTCKESGLIVPATQLDHIKPRKEHPELAYEIENMQGLCLSCHRKKTNRGE